MGAVITWPLQTPRRRTRTLLAVVLIVGVAVAGIVAQRALSRSQVQLSAKASLRTATVKRQDLASRERVSGILGYQNTYEISNEFVPGISETSLVQLQDAVNTAQSNYNSAVAEANVTSQVDANALSQDQSSLGTDQQKQADDQAKLAADQAKLAADQHQLAVDQPCTTSTGATKPQCIADQQAIAADQQAVNIDQQAANADQQAINVDQGKVSKDQSTQQVDQVSGQAKVAAANSALVTAQHNLSEQSTAPGGGGGPAAGGGGASAILTSLPSAGSVVDQGQPMYSVNGRPIPLFYGSQPFGRQMKVGASGPDVQELQQNLIALGYASSSSLATDGNFSAATAAAVSRWQKAIGAQVDGVVNAGDAVVLPGPARIATVKASTGATIQAGTQLMTTTSTTRYVDVALDTSLQANVQVGDPVLVTLPTGGKTTTGRVTSIATVATSSSSSPPPATGGTNQSAAPADTVDVQISLDNPGATGTLDQAPVTVSITSQTAKNVLAVPINALLALENGSYGVETMDDQGRTHVVPVQTGLFDDQDSLVAITGSGIDAGTKVVLPSIG